MIHGRTEKKQVYEMKGNVRGIIENLTTTNCKSFGSILNVDDVAMVDVLHLAHIQCLLSVSHLSPALTGLHRVPDCLQMHCRWVDANWAPHFLGERD